MARSPAGVGGPYWWRPHVVGSLALFVAVFLACAVEAVEATTIVLAAGTAREWRSTIMGLVTALLGLAVIVAVAGPAVQHLPIGALRLVVGGVLLMFGLQWIRKAVLRASGWKALHDEELIFATSVSEARSGVREARFGVSDWYAFVLSFKGVLLEGLEVVFIVVTFGTNQHRVGLAAVAGLAAVVVIAAVGVLVRAPLSRVPENTLKFVVGVLLTAFGILWSGEGAGADWPGGDLSLLWILPVVAVAALVLVVALRSRRRSGAGVGDEREVPAAVATVASLAEGAAPPPQWPTRPGGSAVRRRLAGIGSFGYDFVVGDDWRVAVAVVGGLLLTALLRSAPVATWWILPITVLVAIWGSAWRAARSG